MKDEKDMAMGRGASCGRAMFVAFACVAMASSAFASLRADFAVARGAIRPALHSSGFGPTICSQTAQDLADVKARGFTYARTHDWALINPNQRVCDYFHVFPLMHLDAKDPKSYWFGPTDYLLKRTREEAGLEVFYRLGTSIEHSGERVHFNSLIPDDFDKVAEVFAATVRHYNRGWADGFAWGLKYWEIWNEPEGYMSMWAPKEGTEGLSPEEKERKAAECQAKFTDFFVTVLRRLKGEFGDTIRVGGPALQTYRENWFRPLLAACKAAGLAPDFISWHGYENDPMTYNRQAEKARALCDEFGFTSCELHVNEWHYFGYGDYDWTDMQRCSDPAVKARIWNGPNSHNGIKSACFTLAALANMQRSKLDQAYFYGCRHTGNWGFKDEHQKKYKVFYALKLFGDIVRDYTTICESASEGSVTTFAVRGADGRKGLLVVDYAGPSRTIELDVAGVPADARPSCTLLDDTHDLTPHDVSFRNGRLTLVKPDAHSAAFFVSF